MNRWSVVLFLGQVLVATLAAQRTWVVDRANRPGTNFTDLPPAVAAAAPGDTLVIVGQSCGAFPGYYTPTTIRKGLRLVGTSVSINIDGLLTIADVPASETVVLQNLGISWSVAQSSWPTSGLSILRCAGPVVLDRCAIQASYWGQLAASFIDCPKLTIVRSRFWLDHTATFERCRVTISESAFTCGDKIVPSGPVTRCTSIEVRDSDVTVLSSRVDGATGFMRFDNYVCTSWPSAPGILAINSVVRLGRDARVNGGWSRGGFWPCGSGSPGCSFGSVMSIGSTVHADSRAWFECPSLVLSGEVDAVTASSAWVGTQAQATVTTRADSLVMLVAGFEAPTPIQTSLGDWYIQADGAAVVDIARASGLGISSHRFTADLPVGTLIMLQAAVLLPDGGMRASLPTRVAMDTVPTESGG